MPSSTRATSLFSALLLGLAGLSTTGCEMYDGVPVASIVGLENGVLFDNKAPLVVAFSEPIDPTTLRAKVAVFNTTIEGLLLDEDLDPVTQPQILISYDAGLAEGGSASVSDDGLRLVLEPKLAFPVGQKLVLIIEPGLKDVEGDEYQVRERIPFSYTVELKCAPSEDFVTGAYFFIGDVTQPIGTQVQLLSWIEVNPETGEFVGAFVNADRNRDPARCKPFGLDCDAKTEACRTLPEPACVVPSEKAGSTDEYPDYLVNYTPPTGFSFTATGCVDGQSSDKTVFVNVPVDVTVQSPAVSLRGTVLTASFEKDANGVLRGTGGIVADNVILGKVDSGTAEGTISARLIPPDEVPEDLKKPEPVE